MPRQPIRCKLGRHVGQEDGGTMRFTCPRCGGSFWQEPDMRDIAARADAMIADGRCDEATAYARNAIKRRVREEAARNAR